jgi:small-conductance mechanosensitive channel
MSESPAPRQQGLRRLRGAIAHAIGAFALLLGLAVFAAALPAPAGGTRAATGTPTPAAQAQAGAPAPDAAPARPRVRCDTTHLGQCLDSMADSANDAVLRLVQRIPQLVLALLVILLARWLSRYVGNRLHLLKIRSQNPYMSGLVRMLVRGAILLVGVLIALDLLGLTAVVGAVLGSAGVVGLVLGFAFRDIAENYIAGILLSVRRPFEPGDHVSIENREGKVVSVNSRATVLMTMDGSHLQLPNSLVFKSVVLNHSRNPMRRFDFTVSIDPQQSIRRAQTLAMAAIEEIEGVLDEPAPSWVVVEYGAAGIQLRFFGWVDQSLSDLGKVRSEAIRRVKSAFAGAGIEPPRTIYHVVATRGRDAQALDAMLEPHNDADTSVNRDIDAQVAQARADAGQNLLQQTPRD